MIVDLKTVDDAIKAIKDMYVRGAPLIGATGAYGMYLATLNAPDNPIDPEYFKGTCRLGQSGTLLCSPALEYL
jgi:methylthioribose-1-phosphate isomerase